MSVGRGALIAFEGCDRAGKSTQVKMLTDALTMQNIPVISRAFPDRRTPVGKMINNFLCKKEEFSPETAHLLFSANRWECKDEILDALHNGTTIILDRYAASGAAYAAATTGRSLSWCKNVDRGLPQPDIVLYLEVSKESQQSRSNWGAERFENIALQESVALNYKKLMDNTWSSIDAGEDKSLIHEQVLKKVLNVVSTVKDLPVNKLYE